MSSQKIVVNKKVMVSEIKEYEKVNLYTFIDFPSFDNKSSNIGEKVDITGVSFPAIAEIEVEIKITSGVKVKKWDPKEKRETEKWINEADIFLRKVHFVKS